jgi:uncharacterized membrane protein required for colicin V production
MWLDILICLILLACIVRGVHKGFMYTALRVAGWGASIIAALIAYPLVTKFLSGHTEVYDNLKSKLALRFQEHISTQTDGFFENLPEVLRDAVDKLTQGVALSFAEGVAAVCAGLAFFLLLTFLIKAIIAILTRLFSKRFRGGLMGFLDTCLGLLAGGCKGMLLVYILLAVILPLSLFIGESANDFVSDALFSSSLARKLYHDNLVLLIVSGLTDL